MTDTLRSNPFGNNGPVRRALVLTSCIAALTAGGGCAWVQQVTHYQPSSSRQQPKPVDAKAQQQYYDLGVQQYTAENYGDARKSFLRVVENGPNTLLGLKAQENLKKIERILKTVEEIESK